MYDPVETVKLLMSQLTSIVQLPELASIKTSSAVVGTLCPPAPPLDDAQFTVLDPVQFPVPTQ